MVSESGLFLPDIIESLSFAGNNWYFRDSEGWCILHPYVSFSSAVASALVWKDEQKVARGWEYTYCTIVGWIGGDLSGYIIIQPHRRLRFDHKIRNMSHTIRFRQGLLQAVDV